MHSRGVIPTYNEMDNIERLIKAVLQADAGLEVLVVDDNSPDGTASAVRELGKSDPRIHLLVRAAKLGLGSAYVAGFRYALENNYSLIFEMDADFSHDPSALPSLMAGAKEFDLVIGSRYKNGISVVNWPLRRLMLSLLASLYVRIILGLPVNDCTSGFKCFNRRVLERLDLGKVKSDGYSFQIEMNYRAHKAGFSLGEVPIIFNDRRAGHSKMNGKIVYEALLVVWKLLFEFLFKRKKELL